MVAAVTASRLTRALADLAAVLIHRLGKSVRCGISDCAQERIGVLARIESGMLDDHGHVGFDDAGKIGSTRNGLRLLQIVEPDMSRSPGGDCDLIRTRCLFVGKENHDANMSVLISRVQDACRLMALQFWLWAMTPGGNITFGDGPPPFSDRLHRLFTLLIRRLGKRYLIPRCFSG